MQNRLKEVREIDDADFIELVSGETDDFTLGKQYTVLVDDGSIFTEGERYTIDDQYIANCEFFYNPKLQLKFYKQVS